MHAGDSRFLVLVHSHQYRLVLHVHMREECLMSLMIDWTKGASCAKKAVDKVTFAHYDQRAWVVERAPLEFIEN
jgi:hypothetical protein